MLQHQNEAATRNQVKWRQDYVAIDFLGRDRNADNTRNIVPTRTNRNVVATSQTESRHKFEEAAQKQCHDTIVDVAP